MTTDEIVDHNFGALLYGLHATAVLYMGLDGKTKPNLELARENIAIITTLKNKTHGNLATAETTLINEIISDLQMKYAQVSDATTAENKLEDNDGEA
ncbi:MAG: DUF1844 domain-containing protein [Pseudomonadota bacterium]|nr:DUF1844 domain-containing protein [Pseudomonadota bacterium]